MSLSSLLPNQMFYYNNLLMSFAGELLFILFPFAYKLIRIVVSYVQTDQNNSVLSHSLKLDFNSTKFFIEPTNLDAGNKPKVSFFSILFIICLGVLNNI